MKRRDCTNNIRYGFEQWKLLGFLLLILLSGCDMDKPEEETLPVNPDHGKQVEVNGKKFRIIYIGGVRFRFPDTYQFGAMSDGVGISLNWPDIPPGKAPGTKYRQGENYGSNQVEVIVHSTKIPIEIDKSKTLEQRILIDPSRYTSRDDLKLGLRIFSPKDIPNLPTDAYSLTDDALTPWGHEPVVVRGEFISFPYAARVRVRISMMGWTGHINPDWKGIYLGVVETLNKYRED